MQEFWRFQLKPFPPKTIDIQKGENLQLIVNTDDSRSMDEVDDESVRLAITSPPYFNAIMYSQSSDHLSDVHDLGACLEEVRWMWQKIYLVLQPDRKFFLNTVNLLVRAN